MSGRSPPDGEAQLALFDGEIADELSWHDWFMQLPRTPQFSEEHASPDRHNNPGTTTSGRRKRPQPRAHPTAAQRSTASAMR